MSEPIPNQEGNTGRLNEEERRKLTEMQTVIRRSMAEAWGSAFGETSAEITEIDPFEGKAIEFVIGVTTQGKPASWSKEKLRDFYSVFNEPLPEGAPEDHQAVKEQALTLIESAITQKERENARKRAVGEFVEDEPGEVTSYVLTGEERERPDPRVHMQGADPESRERRQLSLQEQGQLMLQQIRQQKEQARIRELERIRKEGNKTAAEKARDEEQLARANAYAETILNNPDTVDQFGSGEELMKDAMKVRRPVGERTGTESLIAAETPEESDALPEYADKKLELIKELEGAKMIPPQETSTWNRYGWSSGDGLTHGRSYIKRLLMEKPNLTAEVAESIMAAALLHGQTAESFLVGFYEADDPQRGRGLNQYLQSMNLVKDDSAIMKFIYPDTIDQKQVYEEMITNRPGSFEDLVWQMAHAPGTNETFKEGKAMALYRNVVIEKDGKLKCEQRVNTDNMMEWLNDRMLEAHGNNTTKPLDFENEVKIQKSGMGLAIMVYDMMTARTEEMFISQYLKDDKGNALRFGWVADTYEAITNIVAESRNSGIVIPQKMRGDVQELIGERLRTAIVSNMTRDIGGTSLSEQQLKMSESGNGRHNADGKIGAAINTAYIAFCSTYDIGKLADVLGCEPGPAGERQLAELFSLDKLVKARDSYVRDSLINDKQKYRPEYGTNPDLWLDLRLDTGTAPEAKINGVSIKAIFDHEGKPKFLDTTLSPENQAKARKNFLTFINFLNNMTPDFRVETLVKNIITARASDVHGLSATRNGAPIPWRNELVKMVADGMLYRFGMYSHLDNTHSGRSEENKFSAAFREHYNKSYASGGNLFNLEYFPHTMLPESLILRTRKGDVVQNVWEEAARVSIESSRQATSAAQQRIEAGLLNRAIDARVTKITKVGSMPGRNDSEREEIRKVAKKEVFAEEVSRILTTNKAKAEAERVFENGGLTAAHTARIDQITREGSMEWNKGQISEVARKLVIAEEEARILRANPTDTTQTAAPITAYTDVAQKLQFHAEAERMVGTENYKNMFSFSRELAYKTLGLTKSISVSAEGPVIKLDEFIDTFSKRATEITKSFKNVDVTAEIDAWDDEEGPLDEKGHRLGEMRTMTIAEYMVGKPVLKAMKILKDDGTIDNERLKQAAKDKAFPKWMMSALLAGEVRLFREYADYNLSPRWAFVVTESVLESLSRIPGGKDAAGNWVNYLSEEQMSWIREESDSVRINKYLIEILSNFFLGSRGKKDGLFSGLAEMFGVFFKASFQGVLS